MDGQMGIEWREAWLARDVPRMAALAPSLDLAHRVELLLGEALRDARDGFRRALAWFEVRDDDWGPFCRLLAEGEPDRRWDVLAAAYVAARRAPERWTATGRPLDRDVRGAPLPDVAVAAALLDGVAGEALLDAFADLPLHRAVSAYYRVGTLHALGCRPLLTLAAVAGEGGSAGGNG